MDRMLGEMMNKIIDKRVGIAVFDLEDRLVLIKRGNRPARGLWTLPMGHVEAGETHEQAAIRELREETGLQGCIESTLGTFYSNDISLTVYVGRIISGKLQAGDDAVEARLIKLTALSNGILGNANEFSKDYWAYNMHRDIFDELIKRKRKEKMKNKYEKLHTEINKRKHLVQDYIAKSKQIEKFKPNHIYDAVFSYINLGGKSLRPTVLLLSCGAVGGDESIALPAAAAIEVYHTWTLVHDDVIDKDDKRRGSPTVHTEFTQRAKADLGWEGDDASHYGLSIAMLAGDVQQGWSWSLFSELYLKHNMDPGIVLKLIEELSLTVQTTLVEGETLDVQYSKNAVGHLPEDLILDMLWKKTGVLYKFAGRAGAAIGLNNFDPDIPVSRAIAEFCSQCGTAFQIQDDILGIIGDESQLGKPVGSDIREGKRTLLTYQTLQRASSADRELLSRTLGNPNASPSDIECVIKLIRNVGAIDYAQQIARQYVNNGLKYLSVVPESEYKELLQLWAEYLIEREF